METQNTIPAAPKKYDVKYLVRLALLCALSIVMAFTPLGYLHIGIIEISFLCIPVIIGAAVLGPMASTILGLVFGLSSFVMCFGASPFGVILLQINPIYTFLTTVVTRTLMGLFAGWVFKLFHSIKKTRSLSFTITGLFAALLNTALFTFCVLWMFAGNATFQATYPLGKQVGTFIASFVGFNGLLEAVVCALFGFAVGRIVAAIDKRAAQKEEAKAEKAQAKAEKAATNAPPVNSSVPQADATGKAQYAPDTATNQQPPFPSPPDTQK